jgi:hypothetical protein
MSKYRVETQGMWLAPPVEDDVWYEGHGPPSSSAQNHYGYVYQKRMNNVTVIMLTHMNSSFLLINYPPGQNKYDDTSHNRRGVSQS